MYLLAASILVVGQPLTTPETGLVLTQSTKLKGGDYLLAGGAEDGSSPALTIRGDGITVDFGGAVIRCSSAEIEPDKRNGVGLLVEGKNITILNAKIHGAKVGLMARNAPGLKILDGDFSYNWKQRLGSTQEREDLADWMSYHHNEEDEWLRYGAGIYLRDCDGAQVKRCTIEGGQNGLMMTETDRALVIDNNFSFLSSLGLGMYRSSDNRVVHNKIDWCVRGFSYQVYNRGQDSAGILIYEQSNRNVFAYNSVTHGGDGFFLWAGQTTMDTGEGGCQDNLLYNNDFSHAPTNGIEATFSRNAFVDNLMMECWHGIWGGYSYDSLVYGCYFSHNAEAIAWEHGQNNRIQSGWFDSNRQGLVMWTKESEDPNWGYPKFRDTDSFGTLVLDSVFRNTYETAISLRRVREMQIKRTVFTSVGTAVTTDEHSSKISLIDTALQGVREHKSAPGVSGLPSPKAGEMPLEPTMDPAGRVIRDESQPSAYSYGFRFATPWRPLNAPTRAAKAAVATYQKEKAPALPSLPNPVDGAQNPFLSPMSPRGRRYILVDEWGPYDFKRPLLWPRHESASEGRKSITFDVMGPAGKWTLSEVTPGVHLAVDEQSVPGKLRLEFPDDLQQVKIKMTYRGEETVDYRGVKTPAGDPVSFGWNRTQLPIAWKVQWWNYDSETQDPREQEAAFASIFDADPVAEETPVNLNYAWGGSPAEGVNGNHFATRAVGTINAVKGRYRLNLTSDDGVRVWLDGKLVFEDWTWHAPKTDVVEFELDGEHELRIDHFELDGYSALKADIKPVD